MQSLSDCFRLALLTATAVSVFSCQQKKPAPAIDIEQMSVELISGNDDVIFEDISLKDSVKVYDNEISRSLQRQADLLASTDPQDRNIVKSYELWLSRFDGLADSDLMTKINGVNKIVNHNIIYTPDIETSGMMDYAPAIAETVSYDPPKGDCEDMMLGKYEGLIRAGVDPKRLKLLMVSTFNTEYKIVDHAVLAVDTTKGMTARNCLILNIETDTIVPANETDMKVFYSVDPKEGLQRVKTIRINP